MNERLKIIGALLAGMALATGCDQAIGDAMRGPYLDATTEQEVSLMQDAVILEHGAADFSEAGPVAVDDAWAGPDASVIADVTGRDDVPNVDSDESSLTGDVATSDPGDDNPYAACGAGGMECAAGEACMTHDDEPKCVKVDECSPDGALTVTETLNLLHTWDHFYVKVRALVLMGTPACTEMACVSNESCCNQCFAQLFFGLPQMRVVIHGDQMAVGCQGNECDVEERCEPLDSGRWYYLWGMLDRVGGQVEMTLDSFCLVM